MVYNNAQHAFQEIYFRLHREGIKYQNTLALFNVGFYISNPLDMSIDTPWRNWNPIYAEREWQWYLSGNRSAIDIAKKAPIWLNHMDDNGNVNSNYGWQWQRGNQLEYIVDELNKNPFSRRASISIYDAKDRGNFERDTPCTYAINFYITEDSGIKELNMSVMMRSNDIWFGFCNDQYNFAKLQQLISNKLNLKIGTYHHFVNNMHVYEDKMFKHSNQLNLSL